MHFTKMHGAGNDFVMLDVRNDPALAQCYAPGNVATIRDLADRRYGIGCDSIILIQPARSPYAVAAYSVRNADGSVSQQCGNGARCVAAWLAREGSARGDHFSLESDVGLHTVDALGGEQYRIAMGVPQFAPQTIPMTGFTQVQDEYVVEVDGTCLTIGAVSFGNPHALLEVADVTQAQVQSLGPRLQASPVFPESVNVSFAQVIAPDRIGLRVYERGAGETLACGSGACAAAVILMRRGRVQREVDVSLPGGRLHIAWPDDQAQVSMSGPTAFVFDGEWLR